MSITSGGATVFTILAIVILALLVLASPFLYPLMIVFNLLVWLNVSIFAKDAMEGNDPYWLLRVAVAVMFTAYSLGMQYAQPVKKVQRLLYGF